MVNKAQHLLIISWPVQSSSFWAKRGLCRQHKKVTFLQSCASSTLMSSFLVLGTLQNVKFKSSNICRTWINEQLSFPWSVSLQIFREWDAHHRNRNLQKEVKRRIYIKFHHFMGMQVLSPYWARKVPYRQERDQVDVPQYQVWKKEYHLMA